MLRSSRSSGLASGPLHKVQTDGAAGFTNFYESSKHEAEQLLFDGREDLPWRIFRIATVIADDDSGQVSQFNAFHNTLRLLHSGLLSLVPGEPETPLYFVTGDFVADAVFALMQHPADQTVYHVAHPKAASITLGEMMDLAFETFGQEEAFRVKRILRPVYCDAEAFNLLAEGIVQQGAGVLGQAVTSIAPFARQLFVSKDVRNDNLVAAYERYRAPDTPRLVRATCEYLVRSKWGREATHAAP